MSTTMENTDTNGQRKLTPLLTLPVYYEFRKFRKYMYLAINKMPKWIKHSEGDNCIRSIKLCVRCLSVISRTYNHEVKIRHIDSFFVEWDAISDSIEFFAEVDGISNHQRAVMFKLKEGIEGQLVALRGFVIEDAKKQNQQ